jgi:hypothetical protein
MKARIVKRIVHVAHREMRNKSKIFVGNFEGRGYLGDLGIDGRRVFK